MQTTVHTAAQTAARIPRQGLSYKWLVAIVVILGAFMSVLDQTVVNIAIPRLQSAFGADIHSVQWVATVYLLTTGAMAPTASYLANNVGIKRSFLFSLSAFTIGSVLCGLAWSLPTLILFRILQALGGAILLPLSFTMMFSEFPPEERGIALGTLGVPTLLAPALGPILGGYLVTYADWRVIFFINVPIGIVALLLASLALRESEVRQRERFDLPGFLTAAYGLGAVLYGVSESTTSGWGSAKVLGFMSTGALSLLFFVILELYAVRQERVPLLDLRLFRNRSFAAGSMALVLFAVAVFGALFLFPVYLQILRGQNAFQAGVTLLPQALAAMVAVIVGGRLVDLIGSRIVALTGFLILGIATWQLTSMTLNSPYWWIQLMLVLLGLALGLSGQPIVVGAMADIQEPRAVANASTLTTVVRSVGASVGIAVLTTVIQTQTKVHYTHLAEQVTANSPLGQMIAGLQGLFVSHGADLQTANKAAVQLIAGFLQRQGYMLALHDGSWLSIAVIGLAMIAVLFIKERRRTQRANAAAPAPEHAGAAPEPAMIG